MGEIHLRLLEEGFNISDGNLDDINVSVGVEDGLHIDYDDAKVDCEEDWKVE